VNRRSRSRDVAFLAALAVTATACAQILGYSDRDVADGGVDAVTGDSTSPLGDSTSGHDGSKHDSGKPDTGKQDTGTPDTSAPETSTPDTSMPETSTPDTSTPDTSTPDATGDTGTPDAKGDTGAPDAKADTSTPPDAGKDAGGCTSPSECTAQTTLCKTNTCTAGTCGTSNAASGVACHDNGGTVCNGAGICVACNTATDCGATGNACVVATCTSNVCGTSNLGPSTHLPPAQQTAGDCQVLVCNGSGGTESADDPTDLPVSDSACLTNPSCSGTPLAPSFTDAPSGTACTDSGGTMCNATGMCM